LPASRIPATLASVRSRAEKLPFPFRRKKVRAKIKKCEGNFSARQAAALRRLAAGHRRFRFLDLWIKFGKIISKVCCCFLSGAIKYDTNFRF